MSKRGRRIIQRTGITGWIERLSDRFFEDDKGAMLPLMAALVLMTTAGAALAVDLTRAYSMRAHLQVTADSAALAAAIKLPDIDAAREAAIFYTKKNLPSFPDILRNEDFEFGHWNNISRTVENDGAVPSAVRLTLRLNEERGNGLKTVFAGVLGEGVVDVGASAVAGKQGVTCMIALDANKKGIELNGEAELDLVGCGAQSNSTDKESLKVGDKVRMTTGGICVSGRAAIDSKAEVTPEPIEFCPQHEDPMAGFIAPEFGGCTDYEVEYKDVEITLTPGRVFCGGLKLAGEAKITLLPGLYIIDDGKLEIDDQAILEGEGVTILLHGPQAEMDIKGHASLRLSAPTSGDLKGLLIVQDKGGSKENKWNSKEPSTLRGVVYLPHGKFTSLIEANITGTDACFVLIANHIKLDGRAEMSIDLTGTGCRQSLPTAFSRAVALLD